MAQPRSDIHRVLVVDHDARVRAALAALIDATPGLEVAAVTGSTADAIAVARSMVASVVVIDVDAHPGDAFTTIHELAEHLPVVAVSNATSGSGGALIAGAMALCDKNGDADSLTAAVAAAATACAATRQVRGGLQ